MSQHLLKGAHIHTVLKHERGCGVAELMRRVLAAVQSRNKEMFFHQLFHRRLADALTALTDEEGILIDDVGGASDSQIVSNRGGAGLVQL